MFCGLLSWNVVISSQRAVHVGWLSKNDERQRIYADVCSLVRAVRVLLSSSLLLHRYAEL